jgi:hypothetical protein
MDCFSAGLLQHRFENIVEKRPCKYFPNTGLVFCYFGSLFLNFFFFKERKH